MRKAFTLIELLVVLVIMTFVLGLVVPKGSKMLDGFQRQINITLEMQELSKERSLAFIKAKEKNIDILAKHYNISAKGVLTEYEKSNDNN